METQDIKEFYNKNLQALNHPYEQERWFKTAQASAGYIATRSAVQKYALPYVTNDMYVFELGPGPGTWTKLLINQAPNAQYDLVDISEEMLKQARAALPVDKKIQFITSDILDYKNQERYDFFFSSRIIEYVPDKEKAVHNIVASLKQGSHGYIVTKTPQSKRRFGKAITSPVHANQITASQLVSLFEDEGCQIIKKINVTCVFPGLRSGVADRILTKISQFLPFSIGQLFGESYALVFKKK